MIENRIKYILQDNKRIAIMGGNIYLILFSIILGILLQLKRLEKNTT